MIEILVLIFGTRWLAGVAQRRGYSKFLAALFPVFWIVGELFGAVVGALASDEMLVAVLFGLIGAAVSGGIAVAIIHILPAREEDLSPAGPGPKADDARDNVWAS